MAKQKRNFVNVASYLLIVLLIFAICGGIVYFTNGLTTDFKSFYLNVNGIDVLDDKGGFVVSATKSLNVETKYVFGLFNKNLNGYSYSIKSNPEANFSFKVGEDSYDFAGDNLDFSKCFTIVTSKPDEICKFINDELHRGATVSDCRGAFTHDGKKMVITVLKRGQAVVLKQYIRQIDRHAFTVITNSSDILGKGFRTTM